MGGLLGAKIFVSSDRILTCRIKSICSPAKVGLVVTDLITSPTGEAGEIFECRSC